jgi:PAS domain S-box-containing protein
MAVVRVAVSRTAGHVQAANREDMTQTSGSLSTRRKGNGNSSVSGYASGTAVLTVAEDADGSEAASIAKLTQDLQAFDGRTPVPMPVDAPGDLGRLARAIAALQEKLLQRTQVLSTAIESTDHSIIAYDLNGVITLWNRAAERLYGFDRSEAVGMRVDSIVPPDRRQEFSELRTKVAQGEHVHDFETVRLTRDGSSVHVSITVSPTYDADGKLSGFSGIGRDIRERFLAEERLQLAVEAAPSGMLMVDQTGAILLVNAEVEHLFGYSRAALLEMSVDQLVPEDLRQRHGALRANYFEAPAVRSMGRGRDLPMLRKDGTQFPAEVALNPIQTRTGTCVLVSIIDVTSRRQNERELELRTQELETSNADLQDFAYVASHDLQEPLRAVAGYCQLLSTHYRGQLDARADEFIDFAVDGSKRMKRLIDDLLLFSRLGPRTMLTAVDLNRAVADAQQNLATAIAETGTKVEVSSLPTIPGDLSRLVQLFQNLIGNAIKFRGSEPLVVRIDSTPEGAGYLVTVKDNGIGFEASHAERIFKMFQRLHPQGKYEGTGIGLALCKRIVMQHGGRIWATAAPGAGSTFSFTVSTNEEQS